MATVRLLLAVVLAAAYSTTAAEPPVSELMQHLQLLLMPVLQAATEKSLQPALHQLQQGQKTLEAVLHELQQQLNASCSGGPETTLPTERVCEQKDPAVPEAAAPYPPPQRRACARSCLQLRDQASDQLQDGVYWLTGLPGPVFCDFSHDGGGWTLLLTAASRQGWDVLSALERNASSPSLTDNYSILQHADSIRDLGKGDRFVYRIETQAETGRGQWGGIWAAPRSYSFVHEAPTQTAVYLIRRFNTWGYKADGVEKRMPWLNVKGLGDSNSPAVLTTMSSGDWWGTMVTHHWETSYDHSPWIHPEAVRSGTVLYWIREEVV